MNRLVIAICVLPLAAIPVLGQDMPLKDFILAGETWQKSEGSAPRPMAPLLPSAGEAPSAAICSTLSAKGGTVFVGFADQYHVWAYRVDRDGALSAGQPYGTLRTPVPTDRDMRRAKSRPVAVTSMTSDSAGRFYAATEMGIQVFDPTGRLSGVLSLPTAARIEQMGWEGERKDQLVIWADGSKWVRKMNTTGR